MCGWLEPPLAVGASQVRQRTSLLEPSAQRRLDVAVDVSEEEMIQDTLMNVVKKPKTAKKKDSAPISHEQYVSKSSHF